MRTYPAPDLSEQERAECQQFLAVRRHHTDEWEAFFAFYSRPKWQRWLIRGIAYLTLDRWTHRI